MQSKHDSFVAGTCANVVGMNDRVEVAMRRAAKSVLTDWTGEAEKCIFLERKRCGQMEQVEQA